MTFAAMVLAAFVGAALRALVTDLDGSFQRQFVGTLVANIAGAFALGVVSQRTFSSELMQAIGVGGLGAFTTFSTAMLQIECIGRFDRWRAIGATVASFTAILGAAWLGMSI